MLRPCCNPSHVAAAEAQQDWLAARQSHGTHRDEAIGARCVYCVTIISAMKR